MQACYDGSSLGGSMASQNEFGKQRQREMKTNSKAYPLLSQQRDFDDQNCTPDQRCAKECTLSYFFLSSFNTSNLFPRVLDWFYIPILQPTTLILMKLSKHQILSILQITMVVFGGGRHVHSHFTPFLRPLGVAFLVARFGRAQLSDRCDFCFRKEG